MLQQAGDAEAVSESAEPVESADGSDETVPKATEGERSQESDAAEQAEATEEDNQSAESEPVEVPASLVEPQAAACGEEAGDSTAAGDDTRTRVRPLSPRDIVRAANAAARTRAEAARIAVDF